MTQIQIATNVLTEIIRYENPDIADSLGQKIESLIEHRINPPLMTIDAIKADVAKLFRIPMSNFNEKYRDQKTHVRPRQMAHTIAYFCLHDKLTLGQIGIEIGKKDHATVIHSVKTISGLMQLDRQFKMSYQHIFTRYGIFDRVMNYNK